LSSVGGCVVFCRSGLCERHGITRGPRDRDAGRWQEQRLLGWTIRILADTPVQTNRLEELGFQLGLLERTADKLRSCWGQLEPEPSDYESLSLPPRLFPLYYAFRPLRLAAKYTGQAVRHVIERAKEFAAELDFAQPFGDSKRLGEREGVAPVTRTR
jgi:hypothetical protein